MLFVPQIMTPPHERRNFSKIYQKFPLEELQASVPDFNFTQYLDIVLPGQNYNPEKVVIYAMEYFRKLTKIVHKTSKRIVANYILMRFIRHRINNLDKRYLINSLFITNVNCIICCRFEKIQNELYRLLYGR